MNVDHCAPVMDIVQDAPIQTETLLTIGTWENVSRPQQNPSFHMTSSSILDHEAYNLSILVALKDKDELNGKRN